MIRRLGPHRACRACDGRLQSVRRPAGQGGQKPVAAAPEAESWLYSAKWWGAAGAMAAWGMSGSAIYDAMYTGPEKISLNMTPVLIVYSSLFTRWAFAVSPQNLMLAACHATNVVAQCNQMRRVIEYKLSLGEEEAVKEMGMKAASIRF